MTDVQRKWWWGHGIDWDRGPSFEDWAATGSRDLTLGSEAAPEKMELILTYNAERNWVIPYIDIGEDDLDMPSAKLMAPLLQSMLRFYEESTDSERAEYELYGLFRSMHRRLMEQWDEAKADRSWTDGPGHVYFLRSEDGIYKIGHTKELDRRISTLKIQLPYKVELAHTIETPYRMTCEKFLHDSFSDDRMNGEWFRIDEAVFSFLKGFSRLD